MNYEVVVVGGGIGGLTAAALLSARGVSVCLVERQSRPGGCVANFEHLGYAFEPTAGLYSGWETGGVYERIFAELPVKPPEVQRLSPAYAVHLPDGIEVALSDNIAQFEADLRTAFPECAESAVAFYRQLPQALAGASRSAHEATTAHLTECSARFRRFIDVQLQTLTQSAGDQCSYPDAAFALTIPQRGMWAIRGGAEALADSLAKSIKKSGGVLRLDSPVLRLAYASDGLPLGVDLLSGEKVTATRAIISNLTIWDTYGKLIGMSRTPKEVSSQLKHLRGWGAYLLFLGMDQVAASSLRSGRILSLTDWQPGQRYQPDQAQFVFSAAPQWDARAPEGKLAVTVSTFTHAEDWFAFHEDETAHEEQDQAALEALWSRLHLTMPELGDSVEVIETATPRTFYETTRRKFGMVGGLYGRPGEQSGKTIFPNVFVVGDTASSGVGIAGIARSAEAIADIISPKV